MWRKKLMFLLLCLSSECYTRHPPTIKKWDIMVLAQHWLPTNCIYNQHMDPSTNCKMPVDPNSWTIHGVWPTNVDTISPEYCNKSSILEPEELSSVQHELDEAWPDTIKKSTSIWSHEWLKHGTCAMEEPEWNSTKKFFKNAIDLYNKYNIGTIFEEVGLRPSHESTYSIKDFVNTLISRLGKKTVLKCFTDNEKQHLSEVHICFTKTMEIIDCNLLFVKQNKQYNVGFRHDKCDPDFEVIYLKLNT